MDMNSLYLFTGGGGCNSVYENAVFFLGGLNSR